MLAPPALPGPQLHQEGYSEELYWSPAAPVEAVPELEGLGDRVPAWPETSPAPAKVKAEPPGEGEKGGRKPKTRTVFTQEQLLALHQRFQRQHYLTPLQIQQVSVALGLTAKQVKTWFQNRRMKLKRLQKDGSWLDQASWITQVAKYEETFLSHSQGYPSPAEGGCAQAAGYNFTQAAGCSYLSQMNYSGFSSFVTGTPSQHSYYPSYSPALEFDPQPPRQDEASGFPPASTMHFPGPGVAPLYAAHQPFLEEGALGVPLQL
ncbi:homeobox protein NANOG-like [Rhinatrema bivittatum]|uniref:homeobox protein NANOG-like n=1 Tax=Rhinatrema bivittatum TaxID=194408 RepID=UPI00112B29CD|nr:homeobox protein NANOG-like [Rhinatrema bivittatum]